MQKQKDTGNEEKFNKPKRTSEKTNETDKPLARSSDHFIDDPILFYS